MNNVVSKLFSQEVFGPRPKSKTRSSEAGFKSFDKCLGGLDGAAAVS
jgi:hypothetical protein